LAEAPVTGAVYDVGLIGRPERGGSELEERRLQLSIASVAVEGSGI
jgi:hypothetical protein